MVMLPGITVNITPAPGDTTIHRDDDVLALVGELGAGTTGFNEGTLYYGNSLAEFINSTSGMRTVGTDGAANEFFTALFAQSSAPANIVFSPLATATTPTVARYNAAVDLLQNSDHATLHSMITAAVSTAAIDPGTAVTSGTANAQATKLETLADNQNARAYVGLTPQTGDNTAALLITRYKQWGTDNAGPRLVGIANRVNSGNLNPVGYWLGGMIRRTSETNRANGFSYQTLGGISSTELQISATNSGVANNLFTNDLGMIARYDGVEVMWGGKFKHVTAQAALDPLPVARIYDAAVRNLRDAAHDAVGRDWTNAHLVDHLSAALTAQQNAGELYGFTLRADVAGSTSAVRKVLGTLRIVGAIREIEIDLTFSLNPTGPVSPSA